MGIFFKSTCPLCWERDEICTCDPKKIAEYNKSLENIVYKPVKKARFRGVELEEFDRITNAPYDGEQYIIRDFQEDARPIVDLVTFKPNDFSNKPYPHEEIFVIKNAMGECQ